MTIDELIAAGICGDMEEALRMFPVDALEHFVPSNGEYGGHGASIKARMLEEPWVQD